MKPQKIIILFSAYLALTLSLAYSGDKVCLPDCKAPSCCPKTGYIFGYGGFAFNPEVDNTTVFTHSQPQPPGVTINTIDFDSNYLFGAGIGFYSKCYCGMRFEIEGLSSHKDVAFTNGSLGWTAIPPYVGDLQTNALMVNALKEFPIKTKCGHCLTAFVGGGVGWAWTDLDLDQGLRGSDGDSAFAAQLIAGLDVPLQECLSVFVQYKLFHIGETDYLFSGVPAGMPAFIAPSTSSINIENHVTHSFSAGLRLSF